MAEVRLEIPLSHPRARVWRALTEARLLGEWFMPTDLAAREGAHFTLEAGTLPGFLGPVSGVLTELAPPERMVMRWQGEKLHTRVIWELIEHGGGCILRVVQTGFIGAPANLRRRALRDTYSRLFAEQLPGVLDRLAGIPPASPPRRVGQRVLPPAIVPRQGKVRANVAVGAWTAGRSLGGAVAGAAPPAACGPPAAVAPRPAPVWRRRRPAWLERLGSAPVPAWARAVAIGVVAAGLAVLVLATVGSQVGDSDQGTGPGGAERDAPGVAGQSGGVTSNTFPTESAGPVGAPGQVSQAPGSPASSAQEGTGVTRGGPGGGEPEPTASPDPAPPSPAPVLTAQVTTADRLVLGLGGRAVTVTVANLGPESAPNWEVAMDVGDQEVTNVFGADYARDGTEAVFTPVDAELAAGATTQFSFDLPGILASDPSGCTIDGDPCG